VNIVRKLTLRHLKENKGRTVITTLGICVSVAMITAVFVSIASFLNFYGEATIFEGGNKHAEFSDLTQEQVNALKADDRIDIVGSYIDLPEDETDFKLIERTSDNTGIGGFLSGDENYLKQMITCKLDGTVPKNEKEIAVEQRLIEKNNLNWKIGDVVSIPVGERYFIENGERYGAGGVYHTGEEFDQKEIRQFKIVGILHENNPTYYSAKILRGLSTEEKRNIVNATITLKNVNYNSRNVVDDIARVIGLEVGSDAYNINRDYFDSKLAIDPEGLIATMLLPMGLIVLVIIIAASVTLIYNAFSMSLSERTRYLGMLGSVGATRKQKKQSVYYEGFILGLIGIPLGIIGGIVGISITLSTVGSRIVATGMLMGVDDSGISMNAVVPVWAIAAIVVFSALTIFISSVIPAKKASAITPVEALKQSNEFKVKARSLKSPKYIRTIFGYEGELAHKNLKRNGRKSRVITASIAVSVILFLSVNYFCNGFTQQASLESNAPYQIYLQSDYDHKEEMTKNVMDLDGVDAVYSVEYDMFYIGGKYSTDAAEAIDNKEVLTSRYKNLFNSHKTLFVNLIEDEDFNALCAANGIDYKEYYKGNLDMVLLNNTNHKNGGAKVFNENAIGKNVTLEYGENEKLIFTVKDFVAYDSNNYLFDLNSKNTISAFLPVSEYFKCASDFKSIKLGIETTNHEKTYEDINNMLEANYADSDSSAFVVDIAEQTEVMNTIAFVLKVFIYGFITLITMITIANIINTISTSMALRRKEFAMLKSVGATQKGFYKMVCLESLFYGLKALIFSLPISILVSYGMNCALSSDSFPFELNYLMYGCVILAVFLIIGFSMLYSVKKIKKDSIIETLKQDIT
jgi:putative ABC transport system permease protein